MHLLNRAYVKLRHKHIDLLETTSVIIENQFIRRSSDRLIIVDTTFPNLLSTFRIAEFNSYLDKFKDAEVHSIGKNFQLASNNSFAQTKAEYRQHYPQFANRVNKFHPLRVMQCKLMYTVFLGNAFQFIDFAERYQSPFIFTLYPGGGFRLNNETSDSKLARVCQSPNLKRVIATQKITYEYLIDKEFIDPEKIEFIYGGVFPSDRLASQQVVKKHYAEDKESFDICFVAYKYSLRGVDKGYDTFIEVAKLLAKAHKDIYFHVVGPFDEEDIDVDDINDRISFYGIQNTDFFSAFYSKMDVILSPNVPFVHSPGAFDGFPTGACIEAGLCGVTVFCTDILKQNIKFKDRKNIVIIPKDAEKICAIVEHYYENYNQLNQLARDCQIAFQEVFSIEAQMSPRISLLSDFMK